MRSSTSTNCPSCVPKVVPGSALAAATNPGAAHSVPRYRPAISQPYGVVSRPHCPAPLAQAAQLAPHLATRPYTRGGKVPILIGFFSAERIGSSWQTSSRRFARRHPSPHRPRIARHRPVKRAVRPSPPSRMACRTILRPHRPPRSAARGPVSPARPVSRANGMANASATAASRGRACVRESADPAIQHRRRADRARYPALRQQDDRTGEST